MKRLVEKGKVIPYALAATAACYCHRQAWIDWENPSDVLVHDDETIDGADEWPIVRHGGE